MQKAGFLITRLKTGIFRGYILFSYFTLNIGSGYSLGGSNAYAQSMFEQNEANFSSEICQFSQLKNRSLLHWRVNVMLK